MQVVLAIEVLILMQIFIIIYQNQFTFCLLLGGSVDARLENMYFTSRGIREVKKRKETNVFFINVKFKYKFVVIGQFCPEILPLIMLVLEPICQSNIHISAALLLQLQQGSFPGHRLRCPLVTPSVPDGFRPGARGGPGSRNLCFASL